LPNSLEWLSRKIEEGPLTFSFFLPRFCNTTVWTSLPVGTDRVALV
jgi:hypothetical protein